jgi:hypothetical protein
MSHQSLAFLILFLISFVSVILQIIVIVNNCVKSSSVINLFHSVQKVFYFSIDLPFNAFSAHCAQHEDSCNSNRLLANFTSHLHWKLSVYI